MNNNDLELFIYTHRLMSESHKKEIDALLEYHIEKATHLSSLGVNTWNDMSTNENMKNRAGELTRIKGQTKKFEEEAASVWKKLFSIGVANG